MNGPGFLSLWPRGWWASACLLLACGGSADKDGSPSGGASTGTGGSAGTGAAGSGGSIDSSCPNTPPTSGSSCTPPWQPSGVGFQGDIAAHCSWGDDPRPSCRITARCQDGSWIVSAQRCSDALPSACPSPPPASGTECSDTTLSCWYEDGSRCWCSECAGGSGHPVCQQINPPQWACAGLGSCPNPRPNAGSPCDTPGASCGVDCAYPITCEGGVWQWTSCPSCCPICAAPDTPVATPDGERALASLRVGDVVYSVDDGAISAVPILRTGRTPVALHRIVRVVLQGGAVLEMSPGHPTANGQTFADLQSGSVLDELHIVQAAELVPYVHEATYDILPASSTGTYFAAGALVGSTLAGK